MRLHRYALPVIGALVLAVGAMAVACGGDGDDPAVNREYFEEMVRIGGQYGADVQAARAAYDAVVAAELGEEEVVGAFLFLLETSGKSIRAETADRERVEPPPRIEDVHVELLTTARLVAKIYEDAHEGASDTVTVLDLDKALTAVEYATRLTEAQERADEACKRMRLLANEAGVEGDVC
jgi:hypothetical protein